MKKYYFLATMLITVSTNYIQARTEVEETHFTPINVDVGKNNIQTWIEEDTNFTADAKIKSINVGAGTKDSPYLNPYSFNHHSPSGIRYDKLGINTGYIGASSVIFMGVIYAFPVDISNWHDRTISLKNYWKHIQTKPVIDKDDWVINGIGHGVLGAYYYSSARSAGLSAWGSLLYTTFISTFAWEYGIEAIMEIPSMQDLILTPAIGAVLGEGFYIAKRAIVRNNYRIGSSRFFGCFFALILDPLGELTDYATKEHYIFYNRVVPRAKKKVNMSLQITPGGLSFGMKF